MSKPKYKYTYDSQVNAPNYHAKIKNTLWVQGKEKWWDKFVPAAFYLAMLILGTLFLLDMKFVFMGTI